LAVKHSYTDAGVNIEVAARAKKLISQHARSTYGLQVLSGAGFFGV
jgi:phosphoribosylaminoimidazole (AIR) synthetase